MIEQVIYFALGCIVTALLALLFIPVFWSRALRLTRKRLQLQVPLSMQEILAERDQLRAQFAVERLRVEQDLARVQSGKDRDLAAIGRHSIEAARLAEEVEALHKLEQAQAHEIALLTEAGAEAEAKGASLGKELAATHAEVATLRSGVEEAAREHARLSEEGEGHRTSAAALVARLADLEEKNAALRRLEDEIAAVRAELDETRDRHKSFHLGQSLKAEKDRAADRAANERIERLEAENAVLRRAGEATEGHDGVPTDDAGLRESIHALGLAVAAMTREQRGRAKGPAEEPVPTQG